MWPCKVNARTTEHTMRKHGAQTSQKRQYSWGFADSVALQRLHQHRDNGRRSWRSESRLCTQQHKNTITHARAWTHARTNAHKHTHTRANNVARLQGGHGTRGDRRRRSQRRRGPWQRERLRSRQTTPPQECPQHGRDLCNTHTPCTCVKQPCTTRTHTGVTQHSWPPEATAHRGKNSGPPASSRIHREMPLLSP